MLTSATMALTTMLLASTADPTWTVVFESDPSVPVQWRQELSDVVRAQVKVGDVAEASRSDLQVALECNAWGKACAKKVAELMDATQVLSVDITARGRGAWLSYEVISTRKGQIRKKERMKLPDRKEAGLIMAKALIAEALSGEAATILVVETSEPGARVLIDGVNKGVTPAVLTDLMPGAHELRVEPTTGQPLFRKIDVASEKVTEVAMVIRPAAPDEKPDEAPTPSEAGDTDELESGDGFFMSVVMPLLLVGAGTVLLGMSLAPLGYGSYALFIVNTGGRDGQGGANAADVRAAIEPLFPYMDSYPESGDRPFVNDDEYRAFVATRGAVAAAFAAAGILGVAGGMALYGTAGGVWFLSE